MHGSGKMTFANGAVFTGDFKYDLMDGNGDYKFPDGPLYQGLFKEGLQHGLGCLSNAEGETQLFGYWIDGEFSGTQKPTYVNDELEPE